MTRVLLLLLPPRYKMAPSLPPFLLSFFFIPSSNEWASSIAAATAQGVPYNSNIICIIISYVVLIYQIAPKDTNCSYSRRLNTHPFQILSNGICVHLWTWIHFILGSPCSLAGAVEPFMQRKANDWRWMDGWAVWKWPMTAKGEGRLSPKRPSRLSRTFWTGCFALQKCLYGYCMLQG